LRDAVHALAADRSRCLLGERGRALSTRSWSEAVDELIENHYRPLVAQVATAG
jgi:phosphatidylinositol alpha 1,6-mannosyltransferase